MAKILLTGARGMLGRRLHEILGEHHEVVATARRADDGLRALDITDPRAVEALAQELRPDWIVNAAAYTAVDQAESEPELAYTVNRNGPQFLARAAQAAGAVLLHVSTDFVFDGTKGEAYVESDEPGPLDELGVYGQSKLAGETVVRHFATEHLIVRVSWLFGPDGGNFVDTMRRLGRERESLTVVADQRGTPTYTVDAAEVMRDLIEADARGIVHAANRGETTWCDLAREVLRQEGITTPVTAIATEDWPTDAPRPANSALRNRYLEEIMSRRARPWQEALADHLARGSERSTSAEGGG